MTDWQVSRQLKFILAKATWPTGSTKIFTQVRITAKITPELLSTMVPPFMVFQIGAGESQPDNPDLILQNFPGIIVAAVAGDDIGERALIGSNRTSAIQSKGRGLLEFQEEVSRQIKFLTSAIGVKIAGRYRGSTDGELLASPGFVAFRVLGFEAFVTDERFYHPPRQFRTTATGGGSATFAWALPPSRFDTLAMILRRGAAGSPPLSPTSGTGVPLSGPLAVTVTDSPGPGSFSYSLFMTYDETTDGTSDRFSVPVILDPIVIP